MRGVEQAVEAEEGEGADPEAERGRADAPDRDAFGRELEADRADQRPGAEGEDQPDLAVGPAPGVREDGPDHQRGRGQHSPAERRGHSVTELEAVGRGDAYGFPLRRMRIVSPAAARSM